MPKSKAKRSATTSNEAIKVFVRVRPPISHEVTADNAVTVPTDKSIKLTSEKHDITCSYNSVFGDVTTQDQVFEEVRPLLSDVLAGYNGCVFAYGQTSAGKTHTMLGPNGGTNLNIPKERWGILPRSAEFLFTQLEEMASAGNFRYTAKASFLQIYKERLYDLLRGSGSFEDDTGDGDGDLRIREIPRLHDPVTGEKYKKDENRPSEVFITGLSEFRVQTAFDVLKILAMGTANRATRSTNFNDTSSRSHAILQINFEIESKKPDGQILLYRSKLSLVDLAGSEKMVSTDTSSASAHHLKELTSINKSLSSLGNVIASLSKKKRLHVPYRDSKLTRILQDSLGGNTRTILITCIAPTVLHAAESISTLQFADRARNVMLKARANMVIDDKVLLADAQTEIARLKLLLKQALQKLEGFNENKSSAVGEFIDDGETNNELDRVLKENKKLRKDNIALQKTIATLRLIGGGGGGGGSSHDVYLRGGGGAGRGGQAGKKAEWKSSLVDDDEYRKPLPKAKSKRRLNREESGSEMRTSRSNPLPVPTHVPLYDVNENYPNRRGDNDLSLPGIENTSAKGARQQQRHGRSQNGRIRQQVQERQQSSNQVGDGDDHLKSAIIAQVQNANNALQNSKSTSQQGKAVAIGSPSKKSMAAVRKEYNDVVHEEDDYDNNDDDAIDNEDQDDDESVTVDANQFRASLEKAKNSKQLRAVEQSLNKASKNVAKELENDTAALNSIQASRMELERQLKELQMAQAAEHEDDSPPSYSPPKPSRSPKTSLQPIMSSSKKKATPETIVTDGADSMSGLASIISASTGAGNMEPTASKSVAKSSTAVGTSGASITSTTTAALPKPRTKSEVKDQHPPADLKYTKEDVGRKIELYSYKFATWDVIELVDFDETSGNMHKCKSEKDNSEKWIDLKKKPIRGVVARSDD